MSYANIGEAFALVSAGLTINNRESEPKVVPRNHKVKKSNTNETDIYTSNNSRKVRDEYEKAGRKRFRDSREYKESGVVPQNYREYEQWKKRHKAKRVKSVDFETKHKYGKISAEELDGIDSASDSEFSDIESINSVESFGSMGSDDGYHGISYNNPDSIFDKMDSVTNNRKFENRKRMNINTNSNGSGTWTSQLDPMTFDNAGDAVASNDVNSSNHMKRAILQRELEMGGGYSAYDAHDDGTYGVVDPKSRDFIHENMQPFVSRDPSAYHEQSRNDVNTRTLELFTGSHKNIEFRPKTERAPLFSPLIGATNIYGDPVRTDEYKSRLYVSGKRTNELPFQQVKVTPGLDIGYNAVGKHGYHDPVQPMYKNIDELRTVQNRRQVYGSYMGPGKKGEKGTVVGKVTQYKAPTFEERGVEDMVRSRATITAPTIHGEYDPNNMATTNRGVEETHRAGPAQSKVDGNTPGQLRGNYRASRRENYQNDHPRNIVAHESQRGCSHNYESFVPDATQREMKSQLGHAHNGTYHKTMAIDYNDTPDVTKRDIHNKYDRTGHVTGNRKGINAVNWDDVPDVNMRNIHNEYDRSGHVTGNRQGINAVNWDDVPDVTKRDIHNEYDRAGHVTGNKQGINAVNWDDVPDVTKRDIHNEYDRAGHITGNKQGINAVNWDDVPDVTKRDIHNEYDRTGHVTGNKKGINAIDWDDVPDVTKRDIHNKYDRAGHITGNKKGINAVDYDDVPDVTKRDIHNEYDRTGHVTGNKKGINAVDWNDVPDINMRNVHAETDRAGHVTGNRKGINAIDWNDVPDINMRNVHAETDRAGHVTGNKKGINAIDWNDVPDITNRTLNPGGRAGAAHAQYEERQTSRHSYVTMRMNDGKEALEENRAPTKVGMNKGWTIDHTAFQFRDPVDLEIEWRSGPGSSLSYNNDTLGHVNTRVPTSKFYVNERITDFTTDNLQNNPYVNNLIHKSVNFEGETSN
jgi:hypothetical protein